jgi:Phage integrase family
MRAYLSVFSHVFTVTVKEWGWLRDNPMNNVKMPRIPRGRVRYLSEDERQRLLNACKSSRNPWLYTVVVLALSTGARKMELLSLCWRDVGMPRQVITLDLASSPVPRPAGLPPHALAPAPGGPPPPAGLCSPPPRQRVPERHCRSWRCLGGRGAWLTPHSRGVGQARRPA